LSYARWQTWRCFSPASWVAGRPRHSGPALLFLVCRRFCPAARVNRRQERPRSLATFAERDRPRRIRWLLAGGS